MNDSTQTTTAADRRTLVLTAGFASTVAMWALGYLGRLPGVMLPSPVVLTLLVACVPVAGAWLRRCGSGPLAAVAAGAVSGVLNLLVLGSFLFDATRSGAPPAWIWLPGSIVATAAASALGWFAAGRPAAARRPTPTAGFAAVAVGAAFLMLGLGGLVTSTESGLAVVDWPNSFGYNMFLYPFSRMTGGIYYEHAHRLFGALIGLTTVVLAVVLQAREPRAWLRRTGWFAAALVVVQGILGGLRVTGRFTMSDAPDMMEPSLALAIVHGVLGQLLFALLVALAVASSRAWIDSGADETVNASAADRTLGVVLLGMLSAQLVLGALQRHAGILLMTHIAIGVALVAPLCVHVGFRAWGANPAHVTVRRSGVALVVAVVAQLVLGLGALGGRALSDPGGAPAAVEVLLATAHQWFGAVVLGLAVALATWVHRRPLPERRTVRAA